MNNKFRKILILTLSLTLALTAFYGCGGGGEEGEKEDPNAIELQVAFQKDSAEQMITASLATGFTKQQKENGKSVKIKLVPIIAGNYNESILKMQKAGTLPDVVYTYDSYASLWAQKGVFENLDEYFEKDAFDFTKYDENAFTSAKAYQNHIYFAPREYNHPVIFVNNAMMKKYNVDVTSYVENGWTWDEMLEVLKKLREGMNGERNKDYIYPLDSNINWEAVLNPFVKSMNGYLFKVENGQVGFEDENTKNAMAVIDDLITKKYIPDPRSASGGQSFLGEKSAMWITTRPKVSAAVDGEIDLSFLPFPKIGEKHYIAYGNTGYAISSSSDKKQLAWEFIKYIMGDEGQEIFSETGNCIPIILSMQNDQNATWRKYINGVNQDMFVRSAKSLEGFEYVPGAFARGYDPSKERDIYIKFSQMIGELHQKVKKDGIDGFCDYAQKQVKGVL